MKYRLSTAPFLMMLVIAALALPLFPGETPASPPAAALRGAPGSVKASGPMKFEGKVVLSRTDQGEVAVLKTATADYILLPSDKLTELLTTNDLATAIVTIEGEKVQAKDGRSEGLMLKSYSVKLPASTGVTDVASAAPLASDSSGLPVTGTP